VGESNTKPEEPLWTDKQLGVDTAVKEMKKGGPMGVMEALLERERNEHLKAISATA
jgi:5-aminolevulinate synthase